MRNNTTVPRRDSTVGSLPLIRGRVSSGCSQWKIKHLVPKAVSFATRWVWVRLYKWFLPCWETPKNAVSSSYQNLLLHSGQMKSKSLLRVSRLESLMDQREPSQIFLNTMLLLRHIHSSQLPKRHLFTCMYGIV